MKLTKIAQDFSLELYFPNDELKKDYTISSFAPLAQALESDLSFLVNKRFLAEAKKSKAQVLIVEQPISELLKAQVVSKQPKLIAAKMSQIFAKEKKVFKGQSPLAFVSPKASVSSETSLYPYCYIDDGASISQGCVIYPYAYIGENCRIGSKCIIYPGAVLMDGVELGSRSIIHSGAVIGSDGFGFEPGADRIEKFAQTGSVSIGSQVEIGALCTVNRATFNRTKIDDGCKLDSQVHVGHNVEIGKDSMLCGQVGLAGSTKIGRRFIAAGQVGIGPGLEISDHVTIGPKSGVIKSIFEKGEYLGMPAMPASIWRRQVTFLKKLPEIFKNFKKIENFFSHRKS